MNFVHLHNHTEYSLLDGVSKIKMMVDRAKELNMPALAMTDHGSLYGTVYFYRACKDAGIKPIIGCEIYITAGSRHDKEQGYNHLILLAKNNAGHKNLMKLVSKSWLEGYYYKPRTDIELLKEYHEGIICLSACVNGFIAEPLLQGKDVVAENRARTLSEIFGPEHFYIELQKHINVPSQETANSKLIKLAEKLGLPIVATNDNHYTYNTDAEAQEILLCIQTQTTITQKNRKLSMINSPDFYIKSTEEMTGLFIQNLDAIINSEKIADMCDIELTLGKWIMPNFDIPQGLKTADYLLECVQKGLPKRYAEITSKIQDRVDYELSVITKKGYETYFLVVADFVNWARNNGISVGPGRGSAAGSVVSYVLGITDIDPFFFNLPFERFLNPQRPSAPDIDLDFADTRRDEVIAYVTKKYGKDKVAQIITFGKMEARGSVRDVGRALGMPYSGPDRIAKMIPQGWQGHAMTIETALRQSYELKHAYDTEVDTKRLLDLAKKIEGVVRHASVHAAGVVIADRELTEYVPLQREPNGDKVVTQYDMYTVGEDGVGLLKMDFLGLRNLTIIEESLKFIKQNQNREIDISRIPLNDPKTYNLLSQAETTGIFQLESAGMRRYIKELMPSTIFDIMAMVALYRPGPMQNIPEFIARKHDSSRISYPDPRLKEVLSQSYGIITYQDDVLLTTIVLAGFSWLDADKLRKAVGKKIPSEMKKQKEHFIKGCVANGLTEKKAEELFDLIAPFAGYGFNKAHAACYATIAYRTAFLKANYPIEFMTALLTAESRGSTGPAKDEKISQAAAECRRLQIELLGPGINTSTEAFHIEENTKIRFGLSAIKNIGEAAISMILEERENGLYQSLEDFCMRLSGAAINKKTLESLIKVGAMDTFGKRTLLLSSYSELVEKANKLKKQKSEGQESLFGDEPVGEAIAGSVNEALEEMEDFTEKEKQVFEKELLGIYLSSHPQTKQIEYIKTVVTHELDILAEETEGKRVVVGGFIQSVRRVFTKRSGLEMAFITIGDDKGVSIDCILFPKVYELYKSIIIKDTVIIIEGKIDSKNEKPILIADNVKKPKIT